MQIPVSLGARRPEAAARTVVQTGGHSLRPFSRAYCGSLQRALRFLRSVRDASGNALDCLRLAKFAGGTR